MSETSSDQPEAGADTGNTRTGQSATGVICSHEDLAYLAWAIVEKGGVLRFQAHGASMFPLIQNGDIVEVLAIGSEPPAIGDILLTQGATRTVKAHRLISVSRKGEKRLFTTMGDNSFTPDEPVSTDEIIGRVVAVTHGGLVPDLDGRGSRWSAIFMCRLGILLETADRKKKASGHGRSIPAKITHFCCRLAEKLIRLARRLTLHFLMRKARI